MARNDDPCPIWLLLLPCPPSNISLSTLRVAYGPGLTEALKHASEESLTSSNLILDIIVFYGDDSSHGYSDLQRFFGTMYRLICVICTEQRIDLQFDNDVDARLMLVRKSLGENGHRNKEETNSSFVQNCFINLETLARIDRAWQRILAPEGESAEELLQRFLQSRNKTSQHRVVESQVKRLPGGSVVRQKPRQDYPVHSDLIRHHHSVAVGGTFDHLHAGHKLLLTMTALVLNPEASAQTLLTIGITGDKLLSNKQYRDQLEDFHKRQSAVQAFLLGILGLISADHTLKSAHSTKVSEPFGREVQNTLRSGLIIKYVEIFDPCGPTITDEAISALVLSAETKSGGQVVNEERRKKGWSTLEVFEVDVLDAEEDEQSQIEDKFQSKISSTDIRRRIHQKSATGRFQGEMQS